MSISKKRIEEIKAFKSTDFSDIPILTDEQLSQMRPCHLVNRTKWRPQKQTMTMRVDVDVLESLKNSGKGWQTRVNEILRQAVINGRV
jgi:uncharacterized protein (DUF4415 family)